MRRAVLSMLIFAVAALTLTAAACGPSADGISFGEVRQATVTEVVDVPASVTARAVATVTAPADGTIATLAVASGAPVKAGAILAIIDSPSARKRLADARTALAASSGTGVRVASADLSGLQSGLDAAAADAFSAARSAAEQVSDATLRAALLAQVAAAQKRYAAAAGTSRALVRQVQQGIVGIGTAVSALGAAQRVQAKAAVDLAKAGVAALTIRAPIGGVVQFARPAGGVSIDPLAGLLGTITGAPGAAAAGGGAAGGQGGAGGQSGASADVAGVDDVLVVGDKVGAGTAIVTIVDVSEIGLAGEVDETDVLLVSPGVAASVELDAAPGVSYAARVSSVDMLPTPSARGGVAYRIRLAFDAPADTTSPPPTPRPGMSAVVHLRVRTAVDAVAVPAAAVFTADSAAAVWVVRDGVAVRQAVTLGVQGEDLVQIVSGLRSGERVVVGGTDKVSAGQALP